MQPFYPLLAILVLVSCPAWLEAETEEPFNIVNLEAQASRQVANDLMVVTMASSAEADSSSEAARRVNIDMDWALDIVPDHEAVTAKTLSYQTRPLYRNSTVVAWSASQRVSLSSTDSEALTQLVGTLQERLKLQSMIFEVSPEQRQEATNHLITAALDAFRQKARLVATTLGASDYRLRTLSLEENRKPMPFEPRMQLEAVSASEVRAPRVEAGESDVVVRAVGSIQLVF